MITIITLFFVTSDKIRDNITESDFKKFLELDKIADSKSIFEKAIKEIKETLKESIPISLDKIKEQKIVGTLQALNEYKDFDQTKKIKFKNILQKAFYTNEIYLEKSIMEKFESNIWRILLIDKNIKEIVNRITDAIKDNLTLYSKLKQELEPDYRQKEISSEPPFTIRSLLQLSWGLSLNFSNEEGQKQLGQKIDEMLSGIWQRYRPEKLNAEKPVIGQLSRNERFVENIVMSLTKTVRNIGLTRHAHVTYMEYNKKKFEREKKFYENLSSFVSFSPEGIIPKVLAFVGGGSIASFIDLLRKKPTIESNFTIEQLLKIAEFAPNDAYKEETYKKLNELIVKVPETSIGLDYSLILFLIFGLVGIFGLVMGLKTLRRKRISNKELGVRLENKDYWDKKLKPQISKVIDSFYKDIQNLLDEYYPDKSEELQQKFEKQIKKELGKDIDHEKLVSTFIMEKIIPEYDALPLKSGKFITVEENIYDKLKKYKDHDENFSEFIKRMLNKYNDNSSNAKK